MALLMPVLALAQVQQIPEKIYVLPHPDGTVANRAKQRTAVYRGEYLQKVVIGHRSVGTSSRNDTLRFVMADGQVIDYPIRSTDSITFYAPDALMRANMAYLDENYSQSYPQYADDYRNIAGWNSRSNWQLANVHDPTVMKAADGYYYMSQTDAGFGNPQAGKGHFYVRRSKDMVNWEPASSYNNSMVLPNDPPSWLLDSINAVRVRRGVTPIAADGLGELGYWAPCMRKVNDHLYRMYYSIVVDGNYIKTGGTTFDGSWNEPAWIGLAETTDPASGKWVDKGGVLCSASDKGKDAYARSSTTDWSAYSRFNAIDPSFIITPTGEHWLVYGSWHSGIAAIQLDPETGKTLHPVGNPWNIGTGLTTTYGKRIATRVSSGYWARWQGSEGPEVIYNPETGYYYLFLAYDGLDVPYNTRVVRSKNVDGPYVGKNGTNVTNPGGDAYPILTHPYAFNSSVENDGWVGISHCAVWNDGQGNWFFSSQGRKPENYKDGTWAPNAIMMGHVRRIYWTPDGWPVVSPERYGRVEDAPISLDDLVGTWEYINLAYSASNIKTSSSVTIKKSVADDKRLSVSGAISGSGTFDASTNILTMTVGSSTFTLNVARELDWEAAQRKSTIVMAGFPSATNTYWFKKAQ